MSDTLNFVLPWRTIPKPRPRVTRYGTHMPQEYTDWKGNVADFLFASRMDAGLEGPVICKFEFDTDTTGVSVIPLRQAYPRPLHVKGDIDNLSGGVMDALEDGGVFTNDKQVVKLEAVIIQRSE